MDSKGCNTHIQANWISTTVNGQMIQNRGREAPLFAMQISWVCDSLLSLTHSIFFSLICQGFFFSTIHTHMLVLRRLISYIVIIIIIQRHWLKKIAQRWSRFLLLLSLAKNLSHTVWLTHTQKEKRSLRSCLYNHHHHRLSHDDEIIMLEGYIKEALLTITGFPMADSSSSSALLL